MNHLPRTLKDVAHIIGEELDTMTAEFGDICWDLVPEQEMNATFTCDGKLYLMTVRECPPEVRERLGL